MDYCITYFSSAVSSTTEEVVLDIVNFSRENNARLGVTGVLLYINGHIVQVLEGQQPLVEALYKSIQADPRHTDVRVIINQPIAQRLFDQWHMGYELLSSSQYEEVRTMIPLNGQPQADWDIEQPVIVRMLKGFFELNSFYRTD